VKSLVSKAVHRLVRGFFIYENFCYSVLMQKEFSLEELPGIVTEFIDSLKLCDKAVVVGLCGDLGSGKTTFVKELAKQLGVEKDVTSPTFTILQKYEIRNSKFETNSKNEIRNFKTLVHIDLYRFESFEETKMLRLEEVFDNSDNLVLIEWVDKFPEIKIDIKINLKHKSETTREIDIIYG